METTKLNKLTPKLIGKIRVDSGLTWIGDPCYIINTTKKRVFKSLGITWSDFCKELRNKPYKSFKFNGGNEGLGICTSTKYGDGIFNVIGFFEKRSTRPSCVVIDFDGVFETPSILKKQKTVN